ncbi:hypothetical protein D3C75_670180 [compost metagenome]
MHREAVPAQQRQRIVSGGAHHGNPRLTVQGQNAVVFQQGEGAAGDLAGDLPCFIALQINAAFIDIRVFKQPEAELLPQHAGDDRVDLGHRYQATVYRIGEMAGTIIFRQLHVEPGVKRQRRRFGRIMGNAVMLMQ